MKDIPLSTSSMQKCVNEPDSEPTVALVQAPAHASRPTAKRVAEQARLTCLFDHHGVHGVRYERTVGIILKTMCSQYHGGAWDYYTLSNGGFYMVPRVTVPLTLRCPAGGTFVTLSAEGAGLVACALALAHLSFQLPYERMVTGYYRLQQYIDCHREHGVMRMALEP